MCEGCEGCPARRVSGVPLLTASQADPWKRWVPPSPVQATT